MIYVRIERPTHWSWINQFTIHGLMNIELNPPASGPEIELQFETKNDEEDMTHIVENVMSRPVLAIRSD